MGKINRKLLPIKAHFFFFMAAMGPILPQLPVYGRELGISPVVMGSVTAILPIAFLLAKPLFGVIVDVYRSFRKEIFLGLIVSTSLFYGLLYFVPARFITSHAFKNISCFQLTSCNVSDFEEDAKCGMSKNVVCKWSDYNAKNQKGVIYGLLKANSNSTEHFSDLHQICLNDKIFSCNTTYDIKCDEDIDSNTRCLYQSVTFWSFIILMSLGTIGFNVLNSISDAICFDVIENERDYGKQRVWGTIGFGVTALISGFVVEYLSGSYLTYTPAFVVMLVCTVLDFLACLKLELPVIDGPKNIFKDLRKLLNNRHTVVFIIFTTLAGIVDSFIIYFLFWYLEDLAVLTNTTNIKLLEGLTVAAETLGAEILFFYLSGKFLERFGHAYLFSMCFISYGLRFGLISVIQTPWWVIPIEFIMQGPTYALTYSTIVAYANAIAPPGMSATMQGIAAGVDDGFGYAIGSMVGGLLYKYVGGKTALQVFAILSVLCGVAHLILCKTYLRKAKDPLPTNKIEYMKDIHDSSLEEVIKPLTGTHHEIKG